MKNRKVKTTTTPTVEKKKTTKTKVKEMTTSVPSRSNSAVFIAIFVCLLLTVSLSSDEPQRNHHEAMAYQEAASLAYIDDAGDQPPPVHAKKRTMSKMMRSASMGEQILKSEMKHDSGESDFPDPNPGGKQMLIKTGSLNMEVIVPRNSDGENAALITLNQLENQVTESVSAIGGYIESSRTNSYNTHIPERKVQLRRVFMKLRVPNNLFEEIFENIKKIVPKEQVKGSTVSARDVTSQYVDHKARHSSLKMSHSQLLTLMKRANNVNEVLNVQRELGRLSADIESQAARLKSLSNSVNFSTIDVSIQERLEDVEAPLPPDKSIIELIRSRLEKTFRSSLKMWGKVFFFFTDFVVVLAMFALPFFVLLAVFKKTILSFFFTVFTSIQSMVKDTRAGSNSRV